MKKLIFNGYQAENLGFIVVEGCGEIISQEEYELVSVEGRNGNLLINKNTYGDIEKEFTITSLNFEDDDDIDEMINNIKTWLFNITDNKLYYAFENKYNLVKKVTTEDIKTAFEEFGDFKIKFLCEPFYYINEEKITINKTGNTEVTYTFTNNGDFESEPIIKIYGNGALGFYLNGINVAVRNVTSSVEIDTKLFQCTSNKVNKIQDFLTEFPTLKMGENTIIIPAEQNITKIEVTPRTVYR